MEEGQASAALLVPPGFGQSIIAGDAVTLTLRTSPEDNTALAVEQETRAVLSRLDGAATAAHAALAQADALGVLNSEAKRQEYFESSLVQAKALLEDPPALVEVVYAPQARIVEIAGGFDLASPGQLVTWTLITLLGASDVFVNERLGGTLRRLLSTPTRKATILLGKVSGRLFMGLLQMTLLIGFGAAVFRVNWGSSPAALALLVVAFALAAVALGVLLGAFSKTRSQAAGLTIFSSMVMAALGGAWWPLEITPPAYQAAVRVLPSTWAMTGFSDVILRGQGVQQVLPEVGMLLLFAAVFFTVGLARLRFE
jgi:ABC-2 type transport system permease protein